MNYEKDPNYIRAIEFSKKFCVNCNKEPGFNQTISNTEPEKVIIAQNNTIIILLLQILNRLEKIDITKPQSLEFDIDKLSDKLNNSLKISPEKIKIKKKPFPGTFFQYNQNN